MPVGALASIQRSQLGLAIREELAKMAASNTRVIIVSAGKDAPPNILDTKRMKSDYGKEFFMGEKGSKKNKHKSDKQKKDKKSKIDKQKLDKLPKSLPSKDS